MIAWRLPDALNPAMRSLRVLTQPQQAYQSQVSSLLYSHCGGEYSTFLDGKRTHLSHTAGTEGSRPCTHETAASSDGIRRSWKRAPYLR